MKPSNFKDSLSRVAFGSRMTSYQLMALIRFLKTKGVIDEDEVLDFMADYLLDFVEEFADAMVESGFVHKNRRAEFVRDTTSFVEKLHSADLEAPQ